MLHSFERRFDLKCLVKNGFPQKHSKKSEIGTHKRAKRAERGITPAFSRGYNYMSEFKRKDWSHKSQVTGFRQV